jgi:cytochrome c-type biogenesis protein CcmH/NrfG
MSQVSFPSGPSRPNETSAAPHARKWARFGRQASLEGEQATAIFALERALSLGEEGVEAWIALGIARAHERQTEGAIDAFQQAVARDAAAISAWCMMGELAIELKRYRLALAAFERCFELDPQGRDPHGARAKALVRKTSKALHAEHARPST